MNITEANDTQRLLRWVLELQSFEHRTGDTLGRSTVTDVELMESAARLAARSSRTLGAGYRDEQVLSGLARLLGFHVTDVDPDADRDDLADVPVEGDVA